MDANDPERQRRGQVVEKIFRAGLRSVQADRLLRDVDWRTWAPRALDAYDRIAVVGMGKASMALAGEVEAQLGTRLDAGVVVVPVGHPRTFPPDLKKPNRIEVLEAGHPVPDAGSVAAARRILTVARTCRSEDLLVVLISGGGSSLCADFVGAISLDEAQAAYRLLLESGADIYAVNAVRKHISRIGGGRLAVTAGSADVLALVVSDVVGDDLTVIASGPTVLDTTTAEDALDVLRRFDIYEEVPSSIRIHLEAARTDASLDTPSEDARDFEGVRTRLLGTNRRALDAAAAEGERLGFDAEIVSREVTGEAREIGVQMAQRALQEREGRCLLWGGETTVTVRGDGKGGRNQELALAAAMHMDAAGRTAVILSAGTDGRDGPTDAAGAHADESTVERARRDGLEPLRYLERNDSFHFWTKVGGLVRTGPTHTNVMDLQIAVVGGR